MPLSFVSFSPIHKNIQQKFLIIIGGATATGKTALSIELAKHFGAEILSADSRLFYRGMDIGTAKPSLEERAGVPHHFIDICEPEDGYSAGDYERDGLQILDRIFQQKNVAVVVGGSGLFIRALTEGLDKFPEITEEARLEVERIFGEGGVPAFQAILAESDPLYFSTVDKNNPARMRRALEVWFSTGQPYSSFLGQKKAERPFQSLFVLLDLPRPMLYDRINRRVDLMMEAGLEAEAGHLYPKKDLPALQTVGYSELFEYFGGHCSQEEAVEKIKQHSRNYAKRQGTWFRKHGDWERFESNATAPILTFLERRIKNFVKK